MDAVYIPVLNTFITSVVSLLVALGTWHVSMKKDREEQTNKVTELLVKHREEYLSGIKSVQDDVTNINASIQQQIAIVDLKIDTLSSRVEKHNQVIDRTYALEKASAIHEEQIKHLEDKIGVQQ